MASDFAGKKSRVGCLLCPWYRKRKTENGTVTVLDADAATADDKNASINAWLTPTLAKFTDASQIRIAFPFGAMKTSYSPAGFFRPQSMPELILTPLAAPVDMTGQTWKLSLGTGAMLVSGLTNPCPKTDVITFVPRSAIKTDGNDLTVSDPLVQGKVRGQLTEDSNGLTWLCADLD